MKKIKSHEENGIHVITAESMFRPQENVYIHLSTDCPEYVGVLHKHTFIEIVYVISGSAIHETVDGSYKVSKGDIIVVNYDTPHAFYEQGEEKFVAYDLMFTPDFLDTSLMNAKDFDEVCSSFLFYSMFPEQQKIGPDLHLSGSGYNIFGELFNKIYMEFINRQNGYKELVRIYVIELVIKMFRDMEASAKTKISSRQKEVVMEAMSYLQDNYREHITLEALAMHVFLNKDYLNRIFKEAVGLPVNAFLQKIRVDEACRLLTMTEMTIEEIAIASGFGSSKSFYSTFERIMHATPGEYRKRNKKG